MLLFAAIVLPAFGQVKERPLGFITAAENAGIRPAKSSTDLTAKPGDILFENDTLTADQGKVTFSFCPEDGGDKQSLVLKGSVTFVSRRRPAPTTGKYTQLTPLAVCILPEMERTPESSTVAPLRDLTPRPLGSDALREAVSKLADEPRLEIEGLLERDIQDAHVRLALGTMLARAQLNGFAAEQFVALAEVWTEQPRLNKLVAALIGGRMLTEPKRPEPAAPVKPVKHALVIGISRYEQPNISDLQFADKDAEKFAAYLRTPRGGVAQPNLTLLTNKEATEPAIRNHLNWLAKKTGPHGTAIVFIAAHGAMLPLGPGETEIPHIITYRTNAQDPKINGVTMSEIQKLMLGEIAPFRSALIFIDVCHAGHVATILPPVSADRSNRSMTGLPQRRTEFLALMATHEGRGAVAYENRIFGGGHGVFTYFLLRALNSKEALRPGETDSITAARLSRFVRDRVLDATNDRQSPTDRTSMSLDEVIANLNEPGLPQPFDLTPIEKLRIPDNELALPKLRRGREYEKNSAGRAIRGKAENELWERIAAEEEGEEILLRYLQGDEIPQTKSDFTLGSAAFIRALATEPGSHYLQARQSFCEGRAAIFDYNYTSARALLERSIRLDPGGAYAYNALGISYFEQGNYSPAMNAFRDAIQRAPAWAYPRHNLALALTERGEYDAAIREYQTARVLAPRYSYLPYNLGLLYQRMNLPLEAEAQYREASRLAPSRAEPWTALGNVYASLGKFDKARENYLTAMEKTGQPARSMQAARHNYAVLLARRPQSVNEALRRWTENADYPPSVLTLARTLSSLGRRAESIHWYRRILAETPAHVSARLSLAEELEQDGKWSEALDELRIVLEAKPGNAGLHERLGNVEARHGQIREAKASLQRALDLSSDPEEKNRLQKRLNRLTRDNRP